MRTHQRRSRAAALFITVLMLLFGSAVGIELASAQDANAIPKPDPEAAEAAKAAIDASYSAQRLGANSVQAYLAEIEIDVDRSNWLEKYREPLKGEKITGKLAWGKGEAPKLVLDPFKAEKGNPSIMGFRIGLQAGYGAQIAQFNHVIVGEEPFDKGYKDDVFLFLKNKKGVVVYSRLDGKVVKGLIHFKKGKPVSEIFLLNFSHEYKYGSKIEGKPALKSYTQTEYEGDDFTKKRTILSTTKVTPKSYKEVSKDETASIPRAVVIESEMSGYKNAWGFKIKDIAVGDSIDKREFKRITGKNPPEREISAEEFMKQLYDNVYSARTLEKNALTRFLATVSIQPDQQAWPRNVRDLLKEEKIKGKLSWDEKKGVGFSLNEFTAAKDNESVQAVRKKLVEDLEKQFAKASLWIVGVEAFEDRFKGVTFAWQNTQSKMLTMLTQDSKGQPREATVRTTKGKTTVISSIEFNDELIAYSYRESVNDRPALTQYSEDFQKPNPNGRGVIRERTYSIQPTEYEAVDSKKRIFIPRKYSINDKYESKSGYYNWSFSITDIKVNKDVKDEDLIGAEGK